MGAGRGGDTTGTRTTAVRRAAAAPLAAGLAAGLSGCGDSAGPEQGTTLEDLQAEGPVVDDADEDFRRRPGAARRGP